MHSCSHVVTCAFHYLQIAISTNIGLEEHRKIVWINCIYLTIKNTRKHIVHVRHAVEEICWVWPFIAPWSFFQQGYCCESWKLKWGKGGKPFRVLCAIQIVLTMTNKDQDPAGLRSTCLLSQLKRQFHMMNTFGLLSVIFASLAAFSSSVADSFSGFTKLAGSLTEVKVR